MILRSFCEFFMKFVVLYDFLMVCYFIIMFLLMFTFLFCYQVQALEHGLTCLLHVGNNLIS